MESGPGVFAGAVFTLFGAALVLWTGVRLRQGVPVVSGVSRLAGSGLTAFFGCAFLATGIWVLLRF